MYAQQRVQEKLILEQADSPMDFLWLNRLYSFVEQTGYRLRCNKNSTKTRVSLSQMTERQLRDIGIDKPTDFNGHQRGYRNLPIGRNWIV